MNIQFEHFTLNGFKSLVIGATDWLIQLDYKTFALLHNQSMIDLKNNDDHYHCQALIFDTQREWLIACGTIGHGQCTIHDANNIGNIIYKTNEPIVSDQINGSTVLMIGRGPLSNNTSLYVASTSNGQFRSEIMATRSLEKENLMHLVYSDISSGTRLNINNAIIKQFYLEYIYAFQTEGFAFFVAVESVKNRPNILITKLVRICQNDSRYYSYTEVPLRCNLKDQANRAKHAFYLKSKNKEKIDDYLIVVFADHPENKHQIVCIYSLFMIQKQFDLNIAKCFDGQGVQNIHYVHTHFPYCQRTNMTKSDWQCGSDVNQHLDTEDPIISTAIITYNDNVFNFTSITSIWIDDDNDDFLNGILVLTTDNGLLLFYALVFKNINSNIGQQMKSKMKVKKYQQINLNEILQKNVVILSDSILIDDHTLIVMTKNELIKLNIEKCSTFKTCHECSVSADPHCGWCISTNQCMLKKYCPNPSDWIYLFYEHKKNIKCPSIEMIEPSNIAINQRKTIKLFVKNYREPAQAINQRSNQLRSLYCLFKFFDTTNEINKQNYAITKAKRIIHNEDGIRISCPSPEIKDILNINYRHYVRSWLVLAMDFRRNHQQQQSSKELKSQTLTELSSGIEFRFYDCTTYSTCYQCLLDGSLGGCVWCLSEHNCKHNETDCRNDRKLMITNRRSSKFYRKNLTDSCPRIEAFNGFRSLILSEKVDTTIQMLVLQYDVHPNDRIKCHFTYNHNNYNNFDHIDYDKKIIVNGSYDNQQRLITCDQLSFNMTTIIDSDSQQQQIERIEIEISINNYVLDNPDKIHIQLYSCSRMAKNCGQCLSLDKTFECGWCSNDIEKSMNPKQIKSIQHLSKCLVNQQCSTMRMMINNSIQKMKWFDQSTDYICPNPIIIDFEPKYGPLKGNTTLIIKGENLGRKIDDLNITIVLANRTNNETIHCDPINLDKSIRIECVLKTKNVLIKRNDYGHIVLRVGNIYETESKLIYRFVQPYLSGVESNYGPYSGGTHLLIYGKNLDCGSSLSIKIGDMECIQKFANNTNIGCTSPAVKIESFNYGEDDKKPEIKFDIIVIIDGGIVPAKLISSKSYKFTYIEDPVIEKIEYCNSRKSVANYPISIPSGGIKFNVYGKRLNIIQQPQFFIIIDDHNEQQNNITSDCTVINSTLIKCKTPNLLNIDLEQYQMSSFTNYFEFDYGFLMDNVDTDKLLMKINENSKKFHLFPQPTFNYYNETGKINQHLTLTGKHLDSLTKFSDQINITIDSIYNCSILSTTSNALTCELSKLDWKNIDATNHTMNNNECKSLEITIKIGENHRTMIGHLNHQCNITNTINFIVFMIIGAVFLVIIIIMLIIWLFRCGKKRKLLKKKNMELAKHQADVQRELREARLKLQLGVEKIFDESNITVPINRFDKYSNELLFAEPEQNVRKFMMNMNNYSKAENEQLENFEKLLENRDFLLLFIHTLDNDQTTFSMRNRVRCGSCLVMALIHKLIYLTDIMFILLDDLIQANLSKNAKLLLRRNETIVERIVSSWLSLLLFDHLKSESISQALYQLYLAFKIHCYEEPVDELSSMARNTMDEHTMLRTNVHYKRLTINVALISYSTFSDDDDDDDILENNDDHIYQRLMTLERRWFKVQVLDCDSITQVKRKALDALYISEPYYSKRKYNVDKIDLQFINDEGRLIPLANDDDSNEVNIVHNFRLSRINTLAHYGIHMNESKFYLIPKDTRFELPIAYSTRSSPLLPRARTRSIASTLSQARTINKQQNQYNFSNKVHKWHLDHDNFNLSDRSTTINHNNFSPEILQMRRLSMKKITKEYVQKLFIAIFQRKQDKPENGINENAEICKPIKVLFDYFDRKSKQRWSKLLSNSVAVDREEFDRYECQQVAHIWKSNCLPLRFWVNIINNPEFLLDIEEDKIIKANLSVIAQILMESCTWELNNYGPSSPASKILFSEEINFYNQWVKDYYQYISNIKSIDVNEMNEYLEKFSKRYNNQTNRIKAISQLYQYALQHNQRISKELISQGFEQLNARFRGLFQDHLNRKIY